MARHAVWMGWLAAAALAGPAPAAAAGDGPIAAQRPAGLQRVGASPPSLGERLFSTETFGGNGRACSTCHELDGFGTVTPATVQRRYLEDPDGPLFRPIDSDGGFGRSYRRLRERATMRISFDLPTHRATGLSVRKCDAPAATTVVLERGSPTVFNMALEDHLMLDGRDGGDLDVQALNAVHTHAEPGREPTDEELAEIAAFQRALFSHEALRAFAAGGPPPDLPPGRTPAQVRGRVFFEPDRQCGICHSGPMLNRTSSFHPFVTGFAFESTLVGLGPLARDEAFRWCFVDPASDRVVPGPDGQNQVFSRAVPDPGLAIIAGATPVVRRDGSPEAISNELLAKEAGPLFKIPTLWGTPDTAPYFHDNSARDLTEVLIHYNFMFSTFPDVGAPLSEREMADVIEYLQLLSFEASAQTAPGR